MEYVLRVTCGASFSDMAPFPFGIRKGHAKKRSVPFPVFICGNTRTKHQCFVRYISHFRVTCVDRIDCSREKLLLLSSVNSMGTLEGHLVPGLALALLGLWHSINTIKAYFLCGPNKFKSRFWYPLKSSLCKSEYLELILILSFSIFAVLLQPIDFTSLHFSFSLANFEHATMFLHVAIFACFTLFAELNHLSETLSGVSGILVTSVFIQELFLLYYHSTDHVGLEGHYHWLLQLIVCVSIIAAFSSTASPTDFPAAIVLCVSVVFQGCWFINMGFALWFPKFVPQGCVSQKPDDANGSIIHGAVMCESHEAGLRARALANLQFSWILSAILVFVAFISLIFARNGAPRVQSTKYEQLCNRAIEVPIAITGTKPTTI